jgi:hypothetical protein
MGLRASALLAVLGAWLAGCLSPPPGPSGGGDGGPGGDAGGQLDAGAPCTPADFSDELDESFLGSERWDNSWQHESNMLAELEGRAVVRLSSSADTWAAFVSSEMVDMSDRCLHVEVPQVAVASSAEAQLRIRAPSTETTNIAILQVGESICCHHSADTPKQCRTEAYDPERDRWWRIRIEGDFFTCETSPDKLDWQPVGALEVTFDVTSSVISLFAGTFRAHDAPGEVHFDNLNL